MARLSAEAGFTLRERLTAHPSYVLDGEPWIDPRVLPHLRALAGPDGLAVEGRRPIGAPWQEPDPEWGSSGRVDLQSAIDTEGRLTETRSDFDAAYGDWNVLRDEVRERRAAVLPRLDSDVAAALRAAEIDPGELSDEHALALIHADGIELEALCDLADEVRRATVGDDVTYVVTRNINFTNVCYTGCRFCAFAQRKNDADAFTLSLAEIGNRVDEAWAAGATEVCLQGGIDPDLPGSAYFDIAAEVKRRRPEMHMHAFSPMEINNGAARTGPFRPGLADQGARGRSRLDPRERLRRSSTTTSAGS